MAESMVGFKLRGPTSSIQLPALGSIPILGRFRSNHVRRVAFPENKKHPLRGAWSDPSYGGATVGVERKFSR